MTRQETSADLFRKFQPDGDQAFPTRRCLPNGMQDSHQEWAERGTIDGKEATIYWLFANEDADKEDGFEIPFDADHIDRIVIDDEVVA